MLENHKSDFSNLLTKIDAIDISASSSSNDAIEAKFTNIENEYKKIRKATRTKLEEMKITSDILNQRYDSNHIEKPNNSLKQATDKIIAETGPAHSFEMQEKMIPFYLNKGDWLFKQDRIEEALHAWEEVLSVNPDDEYIHSKLLETMNLSPPGKNRNDELHKKYQFKYIGCFGHNILKGPTGIVVSHYENAIFVTDYSNKQIYKFNFKGDYLGHFFLRQEFPVGMFEDDKGNRWVCDFDHSRLLALDFCDNVVDEISIKDIIGGDSDLTHPTNGVLKENQFYLILRDKNNQQARLVSFNRYNPLSSLNIIPLNALERPIGLLVYEGNLYVGDFSNPGLFIHNFCRNELERFNKGSIPGNMRGWVISDGDIFFTTDKYILKMTLDKQDIFVADVTKSTDSMQSLPYGMALLKEGANRILLVVDYYQACVHKFAV